MHNVLWESLPLINITVKLGSYLEWSWSYRQYFHTPWLWDLLLACSPRCVTDPAFMQAVKCDLKWPWLPAFTVGSECP